MMRLPTSTDVWHVVHVGPYDGDAMDNRYLFDMDDELDRFWDDGHEFIAVSNFDSDKFRKAVAEEAQKLFDEYAPLKGHGVEKVFVHKVLGPPRGEYNFQTDCLSLTVEVTDDFFEKARSELGKPEHRERIEKYIERHWKSRSGFISCMPESYDEFFGELDSLADATDGTEVNARDMELMTGATLSLLTACTEPGYFETGEYQCWNDMTEDLREAMSGNHSITEFYPVYKPNELLRKYGLDSELRYDESKDYSDVNQDGYVEYCLDSLAYADQNGDDEDKRIARENLVEALKKENLRRLQEMDFTNQRDYWEHNNDSNDNNENDKRENSND